MKRPVRALVIRVGNFVFPELKYILKASQSRAAIRVEVQHVLQGIVAICATTIDVTDISYGTPEIRLAGGVGPHDKCVVNDALANILRIELVVARLRQIQDYFMLKGSISLN